MAAFARGGSSPSGARCLLMPSQLRCSAARGGCCWPSTSAHQCRAWTDLRGGPPVGRRHQPRYGPADLGDRCSPDATGTVQSYANSIFRQLGGQCRSEPWRKLGPCISSGGLPNPTDLHPINQPRVDAPIQSFSYAAGMGLEKVANDASSGMERSAIARHFSVLNAAAAG
jgi:hypothetical protein